MNAGQVETECKCSANITFIATRQLRKQTDIYIYQENGGHPMYRYMFHFLIIELWNQ